jgi:hypothetical protein
MKLLLHRYADPGIATIAAFSPARHRRRPRRAGRGVGRPLPTGAPGIPPLLAAAGASYGEGFAANAHRFAPAACSRR